VTEDLENRIRAWLQEEGYKFELKVAGAFHEAGFQITVSEFALDTKSGEPREIDVLATRSTFLTPANIFDLSFVIECRYSGKYPWIVFKSTSNEHIGVFADFFYRFATELGHIALLEMSSLDDAQNSRLFSLPSKMGHGVTAAFQKGNDVANNAMTKVCDAAAALIGQAEAGAGRCAILFPVLMLQGRIFECEITDEADIQLAEVKRSTVLWRRPTTKSSIVPVDLVTEGEVVRFTEEKFTQCEALKPLIENGLPKTSGHAVLA